MNERIMQYILEAGTDCSGKWMSLFQAEKLAESIVRECCQMMLDMETKYPANLTVREIKKHFGVEE
jgi:hypothetical protein